MQRASSSRSVSRNGSDSGRGSIETERGFQDDFRRQLRSEKEIEEVDLRQENDYNIGKFLIQLKRNCEGESIQKVVHFP